MRSMYRSQSELLPTTTQQKTWWPFQNRDAAEVLPPMNGGGHAAPQASHPPRQPLQPVPQMSLAPPPPPILRPPPPRPAAPTSQSLFLNKPRGTSLGVKFFGDKQGTDAKEGAEVVSVEAFGLAWRHGLKPGDRILLVRAFSTVRPCEVLSENAIHDGYSAAKALRPAVGRIELRIQRPAPSREALAATAMQAIWRGMLSRQLPIIREGAAVIIQCHFRRLMAMWDARERLDDLRAREHAEDVEWAALTIQTSWRRYDAWIQAYGRTLALQHIQEAARVWLRNKAPNRRSRSPTGSSGESTPSDGRHERKRQRGNIRAPPRLEW